MVWKLIFMVHMVGLTEVGEYSDANECAKIAGELNEAFVYNKEGYGWDLSKSDNDHMRYICAPAPKQGFL
jgi:hypothetical protein